MSKSIEQRRFELQKTIFMQEQEIQRIKSLDNVKLSKSQREFYDMWNDPRKGIPEAEIPFKDEKDFLIRDLNSQTNMYKRFLIKLICDEKGHIMEDEKAANGNVYFTCGRCNVGYKRRMNAFESKEFEKGLNENYVTI
jgi:hypothetical protein